MNIGVNNTKWIMSKLIINFKAGEYSKNKDTFKAIFVGKYKWDSKSAWISKLGYVKATQKMESGAPVTFLVETDFADKFQQFCKEHCIECKQVNSFENITVKEVIEEKIEGLHVNIDRSQSFLAIQHNYSLNFAQRWLSLLRKDDERTNKMLDKPELEIPIDTIFEKEEEDVLA